ncbi:MAG: ankyrin repeat domain-containing protein, partial [bacterium]
YSTVRALVELGADVNMLHNNGSTALLGAAMRRDIKTVRLLLELGADMTIENFDGWSARTWAEAESNPALREVLKVPKTEIHELHSEGEDASENGEKAPGKVGKAMGNNAFWTVFMRAASTGDVETVRRLADTGIEVNGQSPNGTTALMAAVKNGHSSTAFELIELGADLTLTDDDGVSAVEWAAKKGQQTFLEALKERGIAVPEFKV